MPRRKVPPATIEERVAALESGFKVLAAGLVTAYSSIASAKHALAELADADGKVALVTTGGLLPVSVRQDAE